jgi:Archaeal PaREP1/PaREP8 family.
LKANKKRTFNMINPNSLTKTGRNSYLLSKYHGAILSHSSIVKINTSRYAEKEKKTNIFLPEMFLQEADELLKKGDLVQASEKYYKAAEEAIKLLAIKKGLSIIDIVNKRKWWSSELLFKAAKC